MDCPNCDGSGIDYNRANEAVPDPKTGEPIQRGPEPCGVCRGTGDMPEREPNDSRNAVMTDDEWRRQNRTDSGG